MRAGLQPVRLPRRALCTLLMAGGAALHGTPSLAQALPPGNLEMIVPLPPGSPLDALARTFARLMEAKLKQPVVVLSKPGGSFVIGMSALMASPPTGQTLYFGPATPLTVHTHWMKSLPFTKDSFVPVCQTFENSFVLVAGPETRYGRFADVVAAAKSGGAITYAHAGVSSVPHLSGAELFEKAGIQAVDIPYKGEPPMLQDLLGRQIELAVVTASFVVDSPTVKPLVVFGDTRVASLPGVPTTKELGYTVSPSGFGGLLVRAGTPQPVVRRLETVCKEVLAEPELQELARRNSQRAEFLDAKTSQARIEADHASKAQLLKTVKLER